MPWACRLGNAGILNLRIPHFERYPITTMCVRRLLALVHEGFLRIQGGIPIDTVLIHQIIGLPKKGPHPMASFRKRNKLKFVVKVKKYYHIGWDAKGFLVQ